MRSSNGSSKVYEFGPFRVDTGQRFLLRDEKPVHLSPKTFELLVFLIEHPNQVIDKERLMEEVWKDLFVEEANIAVHISTLRKALNGDGRNGIGIETFPKIGYRFNADVSVKSADTSNNEVGQNRRKFGVVAAAAVVGIAILAIVWIGYAYFKRVNTPFQNFTVSKFTTSGDVTHQSISADGKYVAYWKEGEQFFAGGKLGLWVRQIGTGSEIELVSSADARDGPPTFSPDGKYVYYWESQQAGELPVLFKIALLGGEPIRLGVTNSHRGIPNISPDGLQIGTKAYTDVKGQSVIKVINEDGTGERILATRQAPNSYSGSGPWSPDGRFIISYGKIAGEAFDRLISVNVDDGTETIIPSEKWNTIQGACWLADMSGLVIAARGEFSDTSQLWLVPYPSGAAKQITNDANNYFWPSMSADGKTITAIQRERPSQIWSLTVSPDVASAVDGIETAGARLISKNRVDGYSGVANAPGGKVIFTSTEEGNIDIWSMNEDGTGRRQLTTHSQSDFGPSVCGDGRNVVFTSTRNGGAHAWVMDLDGGNQRQLTFGSVERSPVCSPDGQWVAYNSWDSGKLTIWKIPIKGGEPSQLTENHSAFPMFSPDSTLISYFIFSGEKMGVMPSNGGPPVKTFNSPNLAHDNLEEYGWTPDGRSLILHGEEGGVGNLWIQPLDGELRKLTNFTSQGIWWYDWSKDGTRLLFARGTDTSDIVLLSESK